MGATVREAPKSLRARREGQGGAYQYFDLCHGRQCRQYPPLISTICYWDSLAKSEGMPGTHCMHALLPRLFWRTWKLLYTSPCYTIIYQVASRTVHPLQCWKARNGVEGWTNAGICWQPIIFRHCYQKYPSKATWEVFQLTLKSEQPASVSCIHFGNVETAQQSCCHRTSPTMFYTHASYFSMLLSASLAYVSQ